MNGLLLLLSISPTRATQWTVTSYAVLTSYITTDSYLTEPFTDTTTVHLTSLSSTPTVSPYSRTTSIYTAGDVTYITYYLPAGAVAQAVLASATASFTDTLWYFYMDIVYTAPASCPSAFTYTTSTYVDIPSGAENQVTPTSTSIRSESDYVVVSAYLSPSAVSLATAPATTDFVYSDYIASCTDPGKSDSYTGYTYPTPTSGYGGGGIYSGGNSYSYSYGDNCLGSLCPYWLIYIIIFATLIPLLFILGLFESYFWFSRLMKGRSAFRGVPLFWVCISLWALCCLRRRSHAQPEEQQRLEKQWRDMSTGNRLGLWMKYGFRHKNPPQLSTGYCETMRQSAGYQVPGGQPPAYSPPGQQPLYPLPRQVSAAYCPLHQPPPGSYAPAMHPMNVYHSPAPSQG